ncbi:Na+/H+ antiporter [Naganishia albida]|nr:Na+/H+ antiporter [Naganishia albida]
MSFLLEKKDDPQVEHSDTAIAATLTALGATSLVLGLCSLWIRGRLFLTNSVMAMTIGIILGPKVLDVIQLVPGGWEDGSESDLAKQFTRIVLGIQVLSTGAVLPARFLLRKNVRQTLAVLLGPVMLFQTLVVAGFAKGIFKYGWMESLLIGACLSPTDPILASSVVKGTFSERHVPPYVRYLLLTESGINDGAATPYFLLPLTILTSDSAKEAVKTYFLEGLLFELLFAIAVGCTTGWVFRKSLEYGKKYDWVDKESSLVYTVSLAILTIGAVTLIGSNELLACFFAGSVLGGDGTFRNEELNTHFTEGIDNLLDIAVFLTLGTVLPWHAWLSHSDAEGSAVPLGRLVGFAVLVILLRRLPIMLFMKRWIPLLKTTKESTFTGWFGPMGIGAIYYSLKAAEDLTDKNVLKNQLYTVISFIVFTSTIVHGVTVPTFLLASSVHPVWHPKNLIRTGASSNGQDAGDSDEDGELPEATEQTTLLKPFTWLARRYGSTPDDILDGEQVERGDIGKSSSDPDEGEPISRRELHRILNDFADDGEEDAQKSTKRGGQGRLTRKQKEALLNDGSGLEHWDQETEILVYDEGNVLIVTDNDGHVSTRRIYQDRR